MKTHEIWTEQQQNRCKLLVTNWIAARPVHNNPEGITWVWQDIVSKLQASGFTIEQIDNPTSAHRPLLIGRREATDNNAWIGFFGHYDVELVTGEWCTNPWQLTELNQRWYGRGIGDNLLPLAQKLLLFEQLFREVNVLYMLQGEEEIGGVFAHTVYPALQLPEIALWIEETGYFYNDGRQRLLTLNHNQLLDQIMQALKQLLKAECRDWTERQRTLNKSIGDNHCPCHQHLLKQQPYLAIGPNDDNCAIHDINESIDPTLLALPARQLHAVSQLMTTGSYDLGSLYR